MWKKSLHILNRQQFKPVELQLFGYQNQITLTGKTSANKIVPDQTPPMGRSLIWDYLFAYLLVTRVDE